MKQWDSCLLKCWCYFYLDSLCDLRHVCPVYHQQRANLHLCSMMLKCRLETSSRDNLWTSELTGGEQRVTRSPEQLIHETVAAQHRLCLPLTVASINKPSSRGDETIWTWTSLENIPFSLIIHTHTHTDTHVFFSSLSSVKASHMISSDWLFSCTMMRDKEGGLSCVWKVNVSFGRRRAHTV